MRKIIAALLFCVTFMSAAASHADLVHYYSFDSQTARDSVGDSDGTINGDPTFEPGPTGDPTDFAISLNEEGTGFNDDFVYLDEEEFGDAFTITAWIRPMGEQSNQMMAIAANTHGGFAGPDGFKWTVQQWDVFDESLRLETGDTVTGTNDGQTGVIFEDEWQHVAIAFDKELLQYEMFVNGLSIRTGGILDFGDGYPWQIGAFRPANPGGATNAGFIGLIDAVAVFDEALVEEDISEIFDNGIDVPNVGLPGDFDDSGVLDLIDINLLLPQVASGQNVVAYDLNSDLAVDSTDIEVWAGLFGTTLGDSNLDGQFDSGDLVQVFQRSKYDADEDALWDEGDWNGDLRFDSGDLVAAFQGGGYVVGSSPGVPEPSGLVVVLISVISLIGIVRRRKG